MRQAHTAAFQNDHSGGLPRLAVLIHRASKISACLPKPNRNPWSVRHEKFLSTFVPSHVCLPKRKAEPIIVKSNWCRIFELFDFFIHDYLMSLASHGLRGLNNQFTCVFVCHISISSTVQRTAQDIKIYIHPFGVIYFDFSSYPQLALSTRVSCLHFRQRRNRLQVDQEQVIGKMFKADEIITRTIAQHRKWWSRFGCFSSSFFLSFFLKRHVESRQQI